MDKFSRAMKICQEKYDNMLPEDEEVDWIDCFTIDFKGKKYKIGLSESVEDQSYEILDSSYPGFGDLTEELQTLLMNEFEDEAEEYIKKYIVSVEYNLQTKYYHK